jgi:hypothetical protein
MNDQTDTQWADIVDGLDGEVEWLAAINAELLAALVELLGRFNIQDGLSVRDEQAIKHAAAVIAKARDDA